MNRLLESAIRGSKPAAGTRFDPDDSIIISGLEAKEDENVSEKVHYLLAEGAQCQLMPELVVVERIKARGDRKQQFQKQKLRGDKRYKNVYIHSAESHTYWLIELNFRIMGVLL